MEEGSGRVCHPHMIIDLGKHRHSSENNDLQEHKKVIVEEVDNVAPYAKAVAVDKNVINLGEHKRYTQERSRHHSWYSSNIKYGSYYDILTLLNNRDNIMEENTVVVGNTLCYLEEAETLSICQSGGFADSVVLCYEKQTKRNFIKKTVKKRKFQPNEVKHLCQLNCGHISKIFGFSVKRDHYEIFQEYCGLDLTKAMAMSWKQAITDQLDTLILQMATAIFHCNSLNIFHLDIKPQNICVNVDEGLVFLKLTDFGASKTSICEFLSNGYTPKYGAPEMHYDFCRKMLSKLRMDSSEYKKVVEITGNFCKNYHHCSVTEKADLFSIGLTCVFIKYHEDPMPMRLKTLSPEIRKKGYSLFQLYSVYPNLMKSLVQDSWGSTGFLISNLLNGDPSMRWSVDKIIIFAKKSIEEKQCGVNVPCSMQTIVNEVNAVQPTNYKTSTSSPNVPNMDMLLN